MTNGEGDALERIWERFRLSSVPLRAVLRGKVSLGEYDSKFISIFYLIASSVRSAYTASHISDEISCKSNNSSGRVSEEAEQ